MACFTIEHVRLSGVAAAVPDQVVDNQELSLLTELERSQLARSTGIRYRRIAPAGLTAADLCAAAATELLTQQGLAGSDLDVLLLVTQTPDHWIPGTATQLQEYLGMPAHSLALDLNQGCAGYVYGMATLAGLLAGQGLRRGLLLVGDTITRTLRPDDKSTVPVFSDAGSASLMVHDPAASPLHFNLQSSGAGYQHIWMPGGAFRQPEADPHLSMQGLDVFNFALKAISPNVTDLLAWAGSDLEEPSAFVFHQANVLIHESLRKRLRLPPEKMPTTLHDYGNTSSATIPVTLCATSGAASAPASRVLLCGFGVGLSWGSALVPFEDVTCLPIIEVCK